MITTTLRAATSARLFLALRLPAATQEVLATAMRQYPQYIETVVPSNKWHVTLLWLGEVEHPYQYYARLTKAMPQTFVPTLSFTHVGRGLHRGQLWAYAHPSTSLLKLRSQIIERLKQMRCPIPPERYPGDYVPHVNLAKLYPMARGVGLADYPASVSCAVQEINLLRSAPDDAGEIQYHDEGVITL